MTVVRPGHIFYETGADIPSVISSDSSSEMPDTREEPVSGSGRIKDDNSVNREIATLLLNLASRTTSNTSSEPEAMDLSKVRIEMDLKT